MRKLATGITAAGILLGGSTLPVIPQAAEVPADAQILYALNATVFDTPSGEAEPGYYYELEDASGYMVDGPKPTFSEKIPEGKKEAHILGYRPKVFYEKDGATAQALMLKRRYDEQTSGGKLEQLKDDYTASAIEIALPIAQAAIARDTSTDGGGGVGTSLTFSKTNTGTNLGLVIFGFDNTNVDHITTATYAAIGATAVDSQSCGAGCGWQEMFYLAGPATGANNVVVNADTSIFIGGAASSYTGVKQTGNPEASAKNTGASVSTLSTSVTTLTTGAWTVMVNTNGGGTPTAGAGTTLYSNNANGWGTFDSNASVSVGSNALVSNFTSSNAGQIIISLAEAAAAQNNAFFNEF